MKLEKPDFSLPTVLFGGSFDPVHMGHIELARACQNEIKKKIASTETPQIVFLPCSQNPDKIPIKSKPEQRIHFLQLALQSTDFLLWDFEINKNSASYTIDTLREASRLGAKKGNLFFLIGADLYPGLVRWKDANEIRDYAQIIVGNRPGNAFIDPNPADLLFTMSPMAISSNAIREEFAKGKIPEGAFPKALEAEFQRLFLNSTNPYAK